MKEPSATEALPEPRTSEPEDAPCPLAQLAELAVGDAPPAVEVAACTIEQHPTLQGRIRVLTRGRALWVPCLAHVRPQRGDRVLLLRSPEEVEPIVIGVVDGLRPRRAAPAELHTRRVRDDECLRIEAADGSPLLELRGDGHSSVLRILSRDVRLEAAGHLELEAESVSIRAHTGPVHISSSEDVTVQGEHIHLN